MASIKHAFIVVLLAGMPLLCGCGSPPDASPDAGRIGAGSTHLRNIAGDVTGGGAPLFVFVPAAACPSHYDVKPGDLREMSRCSVLLIHPWQTAMANMKRAVAAAGVGDTIPVAVEGNWMVPENQARALEETARLLGQLHPEKTAEYAARARVRAEAVRRHGAEARQKMEAAGVAGAPVLAEMMQAEFLEWAGLRVVEKFGRPEGLSAADMTRLMDGGRAAGVKLVADNLQSGDTGAGEALAGDLGVPHVVLSNFPGGFEGTESWEDNLDNNLRLLLRALGKEPAQ